VFLLVLAHPGSPGQRAVNRLCVCVCVCARVALLTMIAVFQAVVLSTLLYGCESWVLYRRSVRRLDEFNM